MIRIFKSKCKEPADAQTGNPKTEPVVKMLKVLLLGDQCVGKSAVLERYATNSFSQSINIATVCFFSK